MTARTPGSTRPAPLRHFSSAERRAIAAKAGKAAHAKGTAHRWTPEQAKAAAKKGWAVMQANKQQREAEQQAAAAQAKAPADPRDPVDLSVEKAAMP